MPIDLVQLRTFVAVAEEQHLTHAAERLHISQSAASAHVRAVEESLGTQLFVRTNRSLELTRAGQMLLQKSKHLLKEATLLEAYARELQGKMEGRLVIGASAEPGSRLGDIVAALHARHPLVGIDLRVRPSTSARLGLVSGELDIAVVLGRFAEPDFTYHLLTPVPFRVAGPAAWRERIERAGWSEIAALPWITPSGGSTAYTAILAELFGARGLALNSVAQFDNAALARTLLRAGVGMMLMREQQALEGEQQGHLAIWPVAQAAYPLSIAHQTSRQADPLVQAFLAAVRQVWPAADHKN